MATIALYAKELNQMPGLLKKTKTAVQDLKKQLGKVKSKSQKVNSKICNIDDVISTITASTQTQEDKIETLESVAEKVEEFVDLSERVDNSAADMVNKNKEDFYEKYSYLRPDCENTIWHKFCRLVKKTGQWCKEHWKAVATIVLVVVAIVAIVAITVLTGGAALGPLAALALAAAKGVLIGTTVGGLLGGIVSAMMGGSFWEGFEDGAFGGAISGLIAGAAGQWISAGLKLSFGSTGVKVISNTTKLLKPTIGQLCAINAFAEGFASLVGNIGDNALGLEDISGLEMVLNTLLSAALAVGATYIASGTIKGEDIMEGLKIKGINEGAASWKTQWYRDVARTLKFKSGFTIDSLLKGIGADFVDDFWQYVMEIPKNVSSNAVDMIKKRWKESAGGSGT